jgi:hypothetical protein
LQASGTLGAAHGELSSPGRETPKAVAAPSVVVDMGTEAPVPAAVTTASPSAPVKAVGVMHGRRASDAPVTAPAAFSIEVDPELMAELAEHEKSSAPSLPPASGELGAKPGNGGPSAPAVVPAPAPQPQPQPEPTRNTGRRPSSEFNALESDFFAREADLYKHEHPESFDDLDHSRGPNGPNRSR